MPETDEIVINTGPILALIAGLGSLDVLKMYHRVHVPFEVSQEILAGGSARCAKREGKIDSVRTVLERMDNHGIWLSKRVVRFALRESGEL